MIQLLSFSKSVTGVPILSDAAIENDAERLLKDYNPALLKTPQALNVEDFAENYLGLRTHYDYLSHNGNTWGRMVFYNSLILVYVPTLKLADYIPVKGDTVIVDNGLLGEGREPSFRSTMMHECGHKVYHTQYFCRNVDSILSTSSAARMWLPATACRQVDILGTRNSMRHALVSDRDWLEHQAKHFSAATLMPASMVRYIYNDLDMDDGYRIYSVKEMEQYFIYYLATIFRVSQQFAGIRIKQLKLDFDSYSTSNRTVFVLR